MTHPDNDLVVLSHSPGFADVPKCTKLMRGRQAALQELEQLYTVYSNQPAAAVRVTMRASANVTNFLESKHPGYSWGPYRLDVVELPKEHK